MSFEASPELRNFIWQQGFAVGNIQTESLIADFQQQMQKGKSANSSLAMLPAYLTSPANNIKTQHRVLAIDAGGSNLRCGLATLKDSKVELEKIKTHAMPGSRESINKSDFFHEFFQHIEEYLPEIEAIGFCFSYPCNINHKLDGKLIRWTKEIHAQGVENCWIGEELNHIIQSKSYSRKNIYLLNDTVSTLLANMEFTESSATEVDANIGLILGTGTNCAYQDFEDKSIINIESGSYNGTLDNPADKQLNMNCDDSGHYLFEKKISGKYLGNLSLVFFQLAAEQGLLSEACAKGIKAYQENHNELESKHLNTLMSQESFFEGSGAEDINTLAFLSECIIQRAALFTAIQLSAIGRLQKKQHKINDDGIFKINIGVEGSTFFQLKNYKQYIESWLASLNQRHRIIASFKNTEHASLKGAALTAFMQG